MTELIALVVGLMVGGTLGALWVALCCASARGGSGTVTSALAPRRDEGAR